MAVSDDIWAQGAAYEAYMGRWSRSVARAFVGWLAVDPGSSWLDVGCGTGALVGAILERGEPRGVHAIDRSPGFVAHARDVSSDAQVTFEVGDAARLPVADAAFDAAVSGLVLNFVDEPGRMVAEMARATRPAGVVATYVWDYAERMELIRLFWDAAGELDPAAVDLDEGRRFPICTPGSLEALFEGAGLRDVSTVALDVPARFVDFDDYWSPFLGGQGPAPAYVASLPAPARHALRDRLRDLLPAEPDGSIALVARAWGVRGRTPA